MPDPQPVDNREFLERTVEGYRELNCSVSWIDPLDQLDLGRADVQLGLVASSLKLRIVRSNRQHSCPLYRPWWSPDAEGRPAEGNERHQPLDSALLSLGLELTRGGRKPVYARRGSPTGCRPPGREIDGRRRLVAFPPTTIAGGILVGTERRNRLRRVWVSTIGEAQLEPHPRVVKVGALEVPDADPRRRSP